MTLRRATSLELTQQRMKGDLVRDSYSILTRWRNRFSQLLNVHGVNDIKQTEIQDEAERTPRFGRGIASGRGGRTVVGSASSNSGVRAVFSVHHCVVGRTWSLYC